MLNRITTTPTALLPRGGPAIWRQELLTGQAAWLPRLVALLITGCALMSLYLWQASTISTMQTQTLRLRYEIAALERENVALMLQVAQWNSPGYIDEKATELGLRPGSAAIYVHVAAQAEPGGTAPTSGRASNVALWRRLTGWLPQPGG